jgi:RNA polymerase sigma-70 factor (ECF subfamily)
VTQQEFVERVEQVKTRLYRTALLYLDSESMALDAVDEAIYKGFCAYGKLRQEAFFETWMTRILLNVCASELRRRRRETAAEELPETAAEEFDALPLKDAIARLPQELRAVVVLRYFTGLTLEETAQALEVPRGTVSTRQRRALALLKLDLQEQEGS